MRDFMDVTKALADGNRVRVLLALQDGELCVCQIIEFLGLAPSTVSKHMLILRQARLVEGRKDGRWKYYRLADRRAPAHVRKAIAWIRDSLAGSDDLKDDLRRLKAIRKMNLKELCKKYGQG